MFFVVVKVETTVRRGGPAGPPWVGGVAGIGWVETFETLQGGHIGPPLRTGSRILRFAQDDKEESSGRQGRGEMAEKSRGRQAVHLEVIPSAASDSPALLPPPSRSLERAKGSMRRRARR